MPCNTAQEAAPCNTGSCERTCRLEKWSKQSTCSVVRGGELAERWRRVTITGRGNGLCPKRKSEMRHGMKKCITHERSGDDICIAKQDPSQGLGQNGNTQVLG